MFMHLILTFSTHLLPHQNLFVEGKFNLQHPKKMYHQPSAAIVLKPVLKVMTSLEKNVFSTIVDLLGTLHNVFVAFPQ